MSGNVTGWNELISGNIVQSSYIMFDTTLNGWFMLSVYTITLFMLYYRTKNYNMAFVVSIMWLAFFNTYFVGYTLGIAITISLMLFVLMLYDQFGK